MKADDRGNLIDVIEVITICATKTFPYTNIYLNKSMNSVDTLMYLFSELCVFNIK